jgi:hypothetical protein
VNPLVDLPQFYHLNGYKNNFLVKCNRMRFLKTPFKAWIRLIFGGYSGFTRIVGVKTVNHWVGGSNPSQGANHSKKYIIYPFKDS